MPFFLAIFSKYQNLNNLILQGFVLYHLSSRHIKDRTNNNVWTLQQYRDIYYAKYYGRWGKNKIKNLGGGG